MNRFSFLRLPCPASAVAGLRAVVRGSVKRRQRASPYYILAFSTRIVGVYALAAWRFVNYPNRCANLIKNIVNA